MFIGATCRPCGTKKPIFGSLSKNNTCMAALCAGLSVTKAEHNWVCNKQKTCYSNNVCSTLQQVFFDNQQMERAFSFFWLFSSLSNKIIPYLTCAALPLTLNNLQTNYIIVNKIGMLWEMTGISITCNYPAPLLLNKIGMLWEMTGISITCNYPLHCYSARYCVALPSFVLMLLCYDICHRGNTTGKSLQPSLWNSPGGSLVILGIVLLICLVLAPCSRV